MYRAPPYMMGQITNSSLINLKEFHMKRSLKMFFAALFMMSMFSLASCNRWCDCFSDPCGWNSCNSCDSGPSCGPSCGPQCGPQCGPSCGPQCGPAPCGPSCAPSCAPRCNPCGPCNTCPPRCDPCAPTPRCEPGCPSYTPCCPPAQCQPCQPACPAPRCPPRCPTRCQ